MFFLDLINQTSANHFPALKQRRFAEHLLDDMGVVLAPISYRFHLVHLHLYYTVGKFIDQKTRRIANAVHLRSTNKVPIPKKTSLTIRIVVFILNPVFLACSSLILYKAPCELS